MQTLHVRSVPDELYHQVKALAQSEQRSLSAQVVVMLQHALKLETQRQAQQDLLAGIHRRRFVSQESVPDPIEMLAQDRAR